MYGADGDIQHSLITVSGKPWLTWSCDVKGTLGQQEEILLSEVSLQSCSQHLCKAMVTDQGRSWVPGEPRGPTQLQKRPKGHPREQQGSHLRVGRTME